MNNMSKTYPLVVSLALLTLSGCSVKESTPQASQAGGTHLVFTTRNGDNAETRTVLQSDGSVYWSPADEINIFYGTSASGKFTSTNTAPSAEAEFEGDLEGYEDNGVDSFWAVYPYSKYNTFDGERLTVTLPSEQTAVAGTFDDDLFISVARSDDFNLTFYNLCGGVKFQVPEDGIRSVTFSGLNGEVLAGIAKVKLDDGGKPYVESVVDSAAATSIKLNAPDGGTFQTGVYYYMVSFPVELSSGYRMRFDKEGANSVLKGKKSVNVKRSTWGVLSETATSKAEDNYIVITCSADSATVRIFSDADHTQYEYLTLSEGENVIPGPDYGFDFWYTGSSRVSGGKIISREVTDGCINQDYVTSVDLSHWDASNVTNASYMFYSCQNLRDISGVEGLVNVTNAYGMFESCCGLATPPDVSNMTQVTNVIRMFYRCSSLTTPPDVSNMTKVTNTFCMFSGCTELTTPPDISNMTQVTAMNRMFRGCSKLTTPPDVSNMTNAKYASGMFEGCSGLTTPPNVSNMTQVTDACYMFYKCSSLTTPPDLSNMTQVTKASFMFDGCSSLITPPDLSNMTKITDACYMFYKCSSLTTTPDMTNLTALNNTQCMFMYCTSLANAQVGSLDFSSSDLNYGSMFYNTPALKEVTSKCADEAHLSALRNHLEDTHSSKVVLQGETSADGVTTFTIVNYSGSGSIEGTDEEPWG